MMVHIVTRHISTGKVATTEIDCDSVDAAISALPLSLGNVLVMGVLSTRVLADLVARNVV